jgi:enoyl-CoA hydratase
VIRRHVHLTSERDGLIQRVSFPGGVLDARSARELVDVAEELTEQRAARVVVLSPRSKSFCDAPADDLDRLAADPAAAWAALRPPTVAVIRGGCHSVGLELALALDVRVSGPEGRFSLADVANGSLPCWGGTQRLPRAIRPAEATAMLLLGAEIDANRALSLGLLHDVAEDVDTLATALVERLVVLGPLALELAKEAVHRGSELPLRDGLRLEGDLNHLLAATQDRTEGLAAFFDKRPPDFSGR